MREIERRVRGLKIMAQLLLKEATIIEKELGLVKVPTPRKGLAKEVIAEVHAKSNRSLQRRIDRSKNAAK